MHQSHGGCAACGKPHRWPDAETVRAHQVVLVPASGRTKYVAVLCGTCFAARYTIDPQDVLARLVASERAVCTALHLHVHDYIDRMAGEQIVAIRGFLEDRETTQNSLPASK